MPAELFLAGHPGATGPTGVANLYLLKSMFWEFLDELFQSSATAGSLTKLTDPTLIGYTSETWPTKLEGRQWRITGGLAAGDLRMVGKFDRSDGGLFPNRPFSAVVATGDTYELYGNAINSGAALSNLFNAVVRDLKPITDTQITIVTNQRMYAITANVGSRRDIHGVYVRLLDGAAVEPYRIRELHRGLEWDAHDRGGGGALTTTLELMSPLALTPSNQLWLRAETSFSAFVNDASTVDANYQDWIVWEAIYEFSRRKIALGNYDKPRWEASRARATEELRSHRTRWLAGHEPVTISTWS